MKAPNWQRAALAAALALLAQAVLGADEKADAERELARVRGVIASLKEELRAARADRSEASMALEEHERAIARIAAEQRRLEEAAAAIDEQLERLAESRRDLESRVRLDRDALAQQLRVAYALGREDRLKLLLDRRDPDSIVRLLRYQEYFSRERRARVGALEQTLARLAVTEDEMRAESQRLSEVRASQEDRREALAEERTRRAQAISALDAEMSDRKTRLAALERDGERLSGVIKRLREALSDITAELEPPRSFRALKGRLPWPIAGRVVQRFGTPRQDGELAWQGVVLEAPLGAVVRAVAHGRVVFADWLRGFGQMVILDHGNGYMSLYGHNESLLREPGEWVNPGDPVATAGDSGGNELSGLYFEIRQDGKPQDPARWCDGRARFRAAL